MALWDERTARLSLEADEQSTAKGAPLSFLTGEAFPHLTTSFIDVAVWSAVCFKIQIFFCRHSPFSCAEYTFRGFIARRISR